MKTRAEQIKEAVLAYADKKYEYPFHEKNWEDFTAGAEWADKNPIDDNARAKIEIRKSRDLAKLQECLAIAREALEYCAQDYCAPDHNYETGPCSVVDYFHKAREAVTKISEVLK